MVKSFCEKYNIESIEVSSRLGTNVSKCFETLTKLIIGNKSKEELLREIGSKNSESLNSSMLFNFLVWSLFFWYPFFYLFIKYSHLFLLLLNFP